MTEHVRPAAFVTRPPEKLLFLCIHNASRSQIAEGFARTMAPPGAVVMSAGSEPRGLHPLAIEVMAEVGIDISHHASKSLADVDWRSADTVVTLCAEDAQACPTVEAEVRRVFWLLPDPSLVPKEQQLDAFREVRDEIRWRIASLWPRGDQA